MEGCGGMGGRRFDIWVRVKISFANFKIFGKETTHLGGDHFDP